MFADVADIGYDKYAATKIGVTWLLGWNDISRGILTIA